VLGFDAVRRRRGGCAGGKGNEDETRRERKGNDGKGEACFGCDFFFFYWACYVRKERESC